MLVQTLVYHEAGLRIELLGPYDSLYKDVLRARHLNLHFVLSGSLGDYPNLSEVLLADSHSKSISPTWSQALALSSTVLSLAYVQGLKSIKFHLDLWNIQIYEKMTTIALRTLFTPKVFTTMTGGGFPSTRSFSLTNQLD